MLKSAIDVLPTGFKDPGFRVKHGMTRGCGTELRRHVEALRRLYREGS